MATFEEVLLRLNANERLLISHDVENRQMTVTIARECEPYFYRMTTLDCREVAMRTGIVLDTLSNMIDALRLGANTRASQPPRIASDE